MPNLDFQRCAEILGVSEHADNREIRQAYTVKLSRIEPEQDPIGFQKLHEAFRFLLSAVKDKEPEKEDTDRAAAEALYTGMVSQLERLPVQNLEQAAIEAQRIFRATLQQPALADMYAREYFEWNVMYYLAKGWRPGNEGLFEAALVEFKWADEPKWLTRFQIGAVLKSAIDEYVALNRLHPDERKSQLDVLRRLRSEVDPTHWKFAEWTRLVYQNRRLEFIAERFPNLLVIVSNPANVARWRQTYRNAPWSVRLITPQELVLPRGQSRIQKAIMVWGVPVLAAFVGAVTMITGKPFSGSRPETRSIAPQQMSQATRARCNEAHALGLKHALYNNPPAMNPGAAYDRLVNDCVVAHIWPKNNTQSGQIAQYAQERYMSWLMADAKKKQPGGK